MRQATYTAGFGWNLFHDVLHTKDPTSDIGHFIGNAVSSAGREIGHATSGIANDVGKVGDLVKNIPIVGAPIHDIFDASFKAVAAPFDTISAIAKGKNVGQALMAGINDVATTAKELAPYAKMVVSMVPGVGTGVDAAISAGMAIAQGKPIDQVLMAGVAGAIPGGPIAQMAFQQATTLVSDAVQHKKVDMASLAAGAGQIANQVTGGQSVVPPDVQNAIQSGMAMGTAMVNQTAIGQQLAGPALGKLMQSGIQLAQSVPAVQAARGLITSGVRGFDIGQGMLAMQVDPFHLHFMRNQLQGDERKAFDMAMALRTGLVAHPTPPNLSPAAVAGHAMTMGMQGAPPANKAAMMATIAKNQSAAVGAAVAVKNVVNNREAWYIKLLRALHLHQ